VTNLKHCSNPERSMDSTSILVLSNSLGYHVVV
jgi:hypothetical protein